MNWDLTKLYSSFQDERLTADRTRAEEMIEECGAYVRSLSHEGNERDNLRGLITRMQAIQGVFTKAASYVMLTLAVDAGNTDALGLYGKIMETQVSLQKLASAACLYVGGVNDLARVIAGDTLLTEHEYALTNMKENVMHVIDPAIEPVVLQMQLTGGNAWSQLRDQLDARHMITLSIDGETKRLPLSAVRGLACSPDRETRRQAYEAEIAAYPALEIPMAACLNQIKGEAIYLAKLRHFDSVLDAALDIARMDRETLNAMLCAMNESLPMFRKYFRLKAKALGYEGGLKFYDLFAPLGESGGGYTLSGARTLLVDVFSGFSARMSAFIDLAFEDEWIDAYPREGKQGGAFCAGVHPLGISYVMANFDGSLGSVSTLAHELGHAYHNDCVKELSILNANYPMPLAETASIFNETLLTQKLLARANDRDKLTLIDQELTDAAQVIVDILSRYLFETEVFARRTDHAMTPDELKTIMTDAQEKTYGDGLDPKCMHPYMWACKSHYYSPDVHFYNFPYAFGLLFGKGVYARYLEKGDAFLPEYDRLLSATGRGNVYDVAKSVDIDVRDVNFWRASLQVIANSVDEMEKLL